MKKPIKTYMSRCSRSSFAPSPIPIRRTIWFGGASLSGSESHAFISYECLTTLSDLVLVLEQRAKEHKKLAELISDVHCWCSDPESAFSRIHEQSLKDFLEDRLNQLKNPVGLSLA